ncbi:MAG TPA: glycerophosphodiester phosphodiesterase family protein [Balneolales bacterium]|nr:glycerophosphodiester phosphodiesterase family protein [Balneolales bacterium]
MRLPPWLQQQLQNAADVYTAYRPQSVPSQKKLKECKVVSHRGEYDNKHVFENTLPAFQVAHKNNVWGIELDIRWTKDLFPVVMHDKNCQRLFGKDIKIKKTKLSELQAACPLIPTLKQVIAEFGNKLHLMIELKKEKYPDPEYQVQVLESMLSGLKHGENYHFLSLTPKMFQYVEFVPSSTYLLVSETNTQKSSKVALGQNYGGLTGHFLLLTKKIIRLHHNKDQQVGTGFITSKNCLFREIHKNVDWIFSNKAVELQKIIDGLIVKKAARKTVNSKQ